MATEYGVRKEFSGDYWEGFSREALEDYCKRNGYTLIAREVSEPRIVSIRA